MLQKSLKVRCYVEKVDNYWQAFSVEFGLAAQSDTLLGAKTELREMVDDYVEAMTHGEDVMYAQQLLSRVAPLSVRFKYWWFFILNRMGRLNHNCAMYTIKVYVAFED